jgi:hypothetical protein
MATTSLWDFSKSVKWNLDRQREHDQQQMVELTKLLDNQVNAKKIVL